MYEIHFYISNVFKQRTCMMLRNFNKSKRKINMTLLKVINFYWLPSYVKHKLDYSQSKGNKEDFLNMTYPVYKAHSLLHIFPLFLKRKIFSHSWVPPFWLLLINNHVPQHIIVYLYLLFWNYVTHFIYLLYLKLNVDCGDDDMLLLLRSNRKDFFSHFSSLINVCIKIIHQLMTFSGFYWFIFLR